MKDTAALVFLLDVDNTLLDNDRFGADLGAHLEQAFGAAGRDRYWAIYAQLREELGYADYLGALQRFRVFVQDNPALLHSAAFMLEYPFAQCLYPHVLETISQLRSHARTAILSDGDVVFQPRKIQRSGLWDAVAGDVLIYLHKQNKLDAMQRRFPAAHYAMVDDKAQILADMKRALGTRLTTVFVRQGHYAAAAKDQRIDPAPDLVIERIGNLRHFARTDFLPVTAATI